MAKRSAQIEVAFVSAVAAAALTGCNAQDAYHRDWQQCVNQANVVVADKWCEPQSRQVGSSGGYYHWWYSGRPYRTGSRIMDGYAMSLAPSSVGRSSSSAQLSSSSSSSSVSRGGFGSSAFGGSGS